MYNWPKNERCHILCKVLLHIILPAEPGKPGGPGGPALESPIGD